jgi:putative methionine-R-sulfoxide reductase with GAF domain
MDACQGVFYKVDDLKKPAKFELVGSFAFHSEEGKVVSYQDGLIGQAAAEKRIQIYDEVPEDHIEVVSGLGNSSKVNLVLVPIVNSGITIGMIELASFHAYSEDDKSFLEHVASSLGTKMLTLT